jgi:hypothetical protein
MVQQSASFSTPKEGVKMSVENSKPILFLKTTPRDWIAASLPKFKITSQEVMAQNPLPKKELEEMSWSQRHEYLHAYALKSQERRWEDEVGIKPADSHFTLIVPIHNEEQSLPSFLSTLLLSDLPASVNMNIILITNACSDSSSMLIDEFLARLGTVEEKELHGHFKDQRLNVTYKAVKRGSISFMHLETETRGKANALHLGNSIAYESGHLIAMSVDANNYVEPDAIRVMFTHAHTCLHPILKANDTVLLSGMGLGARKTSNINYLLNKLDIMEQQRLVESESSVTGAFMAWNTTWMHTIDGPPPVALEDYGMAILARVNNYKVEHVGGANIWVYNINNLKGLLQTRARYVRGRLQILDVLHQDPAIVKIIEREAYYMKKLPSRLQYLIEKSKKNPWYLPRYIGTFLLWEYALRKAKRDYKRNPTNQSWEKVDFTY